MSTSEWLVCREIAGKCKFLFLPWFWFCKQLNFEKRNSPRIPSPAINIDSSVNAAFVGNKLNAAKSYVDIPDC